MLLYGTTLPFPHLMIFTVFLHHHWLINIYTMPCEEDVGVLSVGSSCYASSVTISELPWNSDVAALCLLIPSVSPKHVFSKYVIGSMQCLGGK